MGIDKTDYRIMSPLLKIKCYKMENKNKKDRSHVKNKVYREDTHKLKKIIDVTLNNYACMLKRLNRNAKIANYILIYYSFMLIVYTLTGKYYGDHFNKDLAEFFGLLLSIVVLVYSLINNNANYQVRIIAIEKSLNKVKDLKRMISNEMSIEKYESIRNEYNLITKYTERREDIDFFNNVRGLCKRYGVCYISKKIKEDNDLIKLYDKNEVSEARKCINSYLSEIETGKMLFTKYANYIVQCIMFIIPVIIYIKCLKY